MTKLFLKQLLTFVLIIAVMAPFMKPKEAEALFGVGDVVFDPAVFGEVLLNAQYQGSMQWKEFVGDTIFYLLNEVVIESLSSSIVNWINSGFEGSPAFVSDLDRHLKNAEADVFGSFLDELNLGFMCSSFSVNIQKSLELELALLEGDNDIGSKSYKQGASCKVDDALANINSSLEEFSNDFTKGGWGAWLHVTQPRNNQYGAYLSARNEALRRRAEASEKETGDINRGSGFLSFSREGECIEWGFEEYGNEDDAEVGGFDRVCTKKAPDQVLTPGSVIEEQLNQTLGTGLRKLEVADEINEIVGALLTQLLNQAIGPGGLFGASEKDSSGSSLTDRLANDEANLDIVLDDFLDQIDEVLRNIEGYVPFAEQMTDRLNQSNNLLIELRECYQRGTEDHGQFNQGEIDSVEDDIQTMIERMITLNEDIIEAEILREELEEVQRTNGEGLTINEISDLAQRANRANRKFNSRQAELDAEELDQELDTFDNNTEGRIRFCQIRNGERSF